MSLHTPNPDPAGAESREAWRARRYRRLVQICLALAILSVLLGLLKMKVDRVREAAAQMTST